MVSLTKEFHSRSLDLYLFEKDRKEGRKEGRRIVFDLLTKDRKGCRAVDQLRAADSARSAVAVAMIPFYFLFYDDEPLSFPYEYSRLASRI